MYGLDFVVHKANDGGCFGGGKAAFDVAKSKDRHGARVKHAHDHSFLSIHGELDGCVRDIAEMESGVTRVHVCAASKATDESQSSSSSVSDTTTTPPDDVTISNVDLTDVHHKAIEAKTLKNMGVMTAIAIGLHNFPEGLATFVAALADPKLGAALAIAIAIHNVPEGICVAMPIYYATGSKWKGFWWSFLSGLSEPVGAIFGYAILNGNDMSPAAFGSLFGLVAGMMVFISVKELIPTALKYDPHDEYVTTYVFVGMAIMAASLILFYL
jgi:ZIP family zinc transporter